MEKELNELELVIFKLEHNEDGSSDLNALVCDIVKDGLSEEKFAEFSVVMSALGELVGEAVNNVNDRLTALEVVGIDE